MTYRIRKKRSGLLVHSTQNAQVQLWMLRELLALGALTAMSGKRGLDCPHSVVHALDLHRWQDDESFDPRRFRKYLEARQRKLEKDPAALSPPTALRRNCQALKGLVGLTDADAAILEFAISVHTIKPLDDCSDQLGEMNHARLIYFLSVILQLPAADVERSLGPLGLLAETSFVKVDHNTLLLRGKFDLLGSKFASNIATMEADVVGLLRGIVNRARPGNLTLGDYEHAAKSTRILLPLLRRAKSQGRKGVNILLYGPPGTGKTELVKAVAQHLGHELYEVSYEDDDGDPVGAETRLRAYRAAQCLFPQKQAILLFDEIEDVFNDGGGAMFGAPSTGQKRKAWINRSLESNTIPTIWVANSIAGMDPAFLRRFDQVMPLPAPPLNKRRQITQAACGDLLPPETIERISRSEVVSPAVVTRAASVVRFISEDLGEEEGADVVEQLINNTLEAQHHPPLHRQDANRLPDVYDPEFIATDLDLAEVAEGLKQSRSGRLCLFGPPGTGKTAYGRWLSGQLNMPLVIRRASDLLSKYLGESEQKMAQAFSHATAEGAILLIDEVDSFLHDRRSATHSWEVSLVNEMLTQMEAFQGVFIASTNLMEDLDQAALRRFDLKVKFDYLRPGQAEKLFRRYCATLGIPLEDAENVADLRRLNQLTPGDFAAVHRRCRFRPIRSVAGLIEALATECGLKEPMHRSIGFTA